MVNVQLQLAIAKQQRHNIYRQYFRGTVRRPGVSTDSIKFTVRYRNAHGNWIWANEDSNLVDGELHFQPADLPESLATCFSKFSRTCRVELCQSQVSDTKLWALSFNVPAAKKKSSSTTEYLGVPVQVARWLTLVRISTPWLVPRHGKGVFKTTEDTMMCSFLRRDGLHMVLLAISGVDDMLTVFRDDDFGGITMKARNELERPCEAKVIAAVGYSHETALATCMYHARDLVKSSATSFSDKVEELGWKARDDPEAQWNQQWTDGLGYCTWNALGQDLTEQKIMDALDSLEKSNINISTLIIDDNWQSLDNEDAYQDDRGWSDFEANPRAFPRGLRKAVTDFRDKHPSILHVTVWHAILGYWGGISPTGSIAQQYKTKVIQKEDLGRVASGSMTVVDSSDVERLYDDFYSFLLDSRIDSVKTDAQSFLDLIASPGDRRTLIRAYQDAWTIASLKYMRNKCISCMSLVPQIIFHSQFPTNRPAVTLRNSDDFAPDNPSSHPWHIWSNAYNALLTQYLNVLPDWDMFQTAHPSSAFHAAARCVSGGPIYITDTPGKHDLELIRQMTAVTNQGATVTLRPSTIARTISSGVYTAYQEPRLLKIGSYHGRSETGVGILGAFNVTPHPLTDFVALAEFRGVLAGRTYIIRSYSTGKISQPMALGDDMPLLSLELEKEGWEILTCYPVESIEREGKKMDVVPLGLLGKMSGAAALMGWEADPEMGKRLLVKVTVKALGRLGECSRREIPLWAVGEG